MTLSSWLSLAAVSALGAMSPGPSLVVIARQTFGESRRHGLVAAVSHGLAVGTYAVLVALGLGAALAALPGLERALTWGGAAYLAWLGIKALRSGPGTLDNPEQRGARPVSLGVAAREGFLVAFLNPKLAVFFTALFAQFIEPGQSAGMIVLLAATVWLIDTSWYLVVVLLLSRARWLSWIQTHGRWIDRITGLVLLAIAVRVVTL